MKNPLRTFRRLSCVLTIGSLCSCSADSSRVEKAAFLNSVETAQFTAAVVTEQLHSQVTTRLDKDGTRKLLALIACGRPPKVNKTPDQDAGYAPTSYIVSFFGTKSPFRVTFFGRCESCITNGDVDLDFGDADAKALSVLIDPRHLWVY